MRQSDKWIYPAIGEYVRIKSDPRMMASATARYNAGKIVRVIKAGPGFYIKSDLPGCGGIWLNEIEPYQELTYEVV